MKNILLILCLALALTPALHAQSRWEAAGGVGVGSTSEIINVMSEIIVTAVPMGIQLKNSTLSGAWHVAGRYSLGRRWSVGGALALDCHTADGFYLNQHTGSFRSQYYTLAVETTFDYVQTALVRLYATVGMGGTLYQQTYTPLGTGHTASDRQAFFNFQVTPIGLKVGKAVGGFAELGVGYKGIVAAGVYVRF